MKKTELETTKHRVITPDGWSLVLKRVCCREHLNKSLRPTVIVPGYGMNSFIFGYHPNGLSMEAFFAQKGFEMWTVELRGQGDASHPDKPDGFGLLEMASTDLTAACKFIIDETRTKAKRVNAIGCSLGGSILFAHLALNDSHRLGSVTAMGAPLRWEKIHPLIRLAFASPTLVAHLPHRGTRRLAGVLFPLALKVPRSLHIYLHPEICDTSDYRTLLKTVDDPTPTINRQMAQWLKKRDLVLGGTNVTKAMRHVDIPLLCVLANADGIVPPQSALSAVNNWGHDTKDVLRVGDASKKFAHADLFISRYSHELVFEPMADWLQKHGRVTEEGS